jgi:hypothetical protein
MADRNRDWRSDADRDWRAPEPDSRRFDRDPGYRGYGDYGTDDVRSFGVPRDYPDAAYPPYWMRDENPRQGFGAPHDRESWNAQDQWGERDRSTSGERTPQGPMWQNPRTPGPSEQRRGKFFGRGPKGYRRSDERIREEISDRLMANPDVDASDIELSVAQGIVTLTGTVEDRHEKRIVDYIAEDAVGVDDVNNQLKVRHGFWASLTGEREKAGERELRRQPEREMAKPAPSGRGNAGRGGTAR